jgi:formylglycine-generating enzyme required for sulfatase activity
MKDLKLEWQENPPSDPMTWDEANEYVKSLGEGWRLPSIKELKDAYDNKIEGFKSDYYWTSNVNTNGDINAIGVCFGFGDVGYYGKTDHYYVRCVREVN